MSLVVVQAVGLVTVQDLGRPGRMHEGLAPGGALVPSLLVAANRAAGNPDGAAALEVIGKLVVRAEREVATSVRVLAPGEELALACEPMRVAYLAIRGGVAAPVVLGGRGAQLSAGLGARLRANDRIAPGDAPRTQAPPPSRHVRATIRVLPGPDLDAFAPGVLDVLVSAPYRVLPTSDRVGTRLDGPKLPRIAAETRSRPMVRGAIEVPRDGAPIVLGPEHPTTGGYPIVGVVAHDDLDLVFDTRVGGNVRFEVTHAG